MFHSLSLGAGVQSTCLALMFAHGEVPGIKLDCAVFADTQGEPAAVYAHLMWLKDEIAKCQFPFPVHEVTAGSLEKAATRLAISKKTGNCYLRTLIPAFVQKPNGKKALMGRRCTAEFKVRQLVKAQRRLANVPRACKVHMVTSYIGISYDEVHRMKPSTEKWSRNAWPLVDAKMTREDCHKWMTAHGYPLSPRSACVFCPFHSDAEWKRLKDEDPADFAAAVEFDKRLREKARLQTGTAKLVGDVFLHGSCAPLDQVEFTEAQQVDAFGNECTGLCGV